MHCMARLLVWFRFDRASTVAACLRRSGAPPRLYDDASFFFLYDVFETVERSIVNANVDTPKGAGIFERFS